MFTANLSNLPPGVSQSDCEQYGSICTEDISVDEFIRSISEYGDTSLASAPEAIQDMYQEWLRDDHYPLSPVNKDHFEELYDKFLESLVKGKACGRAA